MKISFTQIYIQVGKTFPFSHILQRFLSEKISEIVKPSSKFIELLGEDCNLIFNVSAKWQLATNEVVGPKVSKKYKEAEHTIFLPYTPIMETAEPYKNALEHLFDGVYCVLEQWEIDSSQLKAMQEQFINEIISSPEMFTNEKI